MWRWVVYRGEGASTRVVVRRRVIGLQLQLRLVGGRRYVGGPADGSLRNDHATCLSNENSDNADNPSEVVMHSDWLSTLSSGVQ